VPYPVELKRSKVRENGEFRARESIERGWIQAQARQMLEGPTVMAELRQRVKDRGTKRA